MPKKIVVIEDDQDILDIVEYILTSNGYEVFPYPKFQPLSIIEQLEPDVILLDEWLEAMRGSQLCRQLKSNPATQNIPVLIISALTSIESIVEEAGADGYIKKPFDIDSFLTVIEQVAGKP